MAYTHTHTRTHAHTHIHVHAPITHALLLHTTPFAAQIVKTLRSENVDEVYMWADYEQTVLTANSPLTLSNLSLGVLVDMMRRSEIPGICELEHFT